MTDPETENRLSPGGMAPEEISGRASDCVALAQPPILGTHATPPGDVWLRCVDIARELGVSRQTVQIRARREGWPMRAIANRFEYQPPQEITAAVLLSRGPASEKEIHVRFASLAHSARTRETVLLREESVLAVREAALKIEISQARACAVAEFASRQLGDGSFFRVSIRSLERWETLYREFGLDGLVPQQRGHTGKQSAQLPENLRRLGQTLAHEHGSIARGARALAAHPELPADCRKVLHGAHSSKSYVTPSIRDQLRIAPLTSARLQGPRAARLASPFTMRDWSQFKAGRIFTADDMTSNVLCWTEWPNKHGWLIRQPQVLAVMDVGSLRWLNVRVIVRESGQYTADDVWGLFGDVFDTFGLPHDGFLLEFGSWQSKKVKGETTGLTHEDRIGGLASLKLRVFPSFDPRSKGMLESMFNQLQHEMDRCPGWTGREQRYDRPEWIAAAIADCEKRGEHPRRYFPHLKDLGTHVQTAMGNLNHERNDGQICRGSSPLERWAGDAPRLREIPDEYKWLYRSAMNVSQVTRNGVRITQGSGPKMLVHYYDNPAITVPRQGQKMIVFWNDKNPETDVCLLDAQRRFLGVAKYVQKLRAFDATPDELAGEASRKREAMHHARTELRAIQPDLQRGRVQMISADAACDDAGQQIRAAADRAASAESSRAQTKRELARVEVTREDLGAALERGCAEGQPQMSADEIDNLFNPQ